MKDGGSAFPIPAVMPTVKQDGIVTVHTAFEPAQPGMSLRDYLAAQGLPVLASGHCDAGASVVWVRPQYFDGLASDCYKLADAMLKARLMN